MDLAFKGIALLAFELLNSRTDFLLQYFKDLLVSSRDIHNLLAYSKFHQYGKGYFKKTNSKNLFG